MLKTWGVAKFGGLRHDGGIIRSKNCAFVVSEEVEMCGMDVREADCWKLV